MQSALSPSLRGMSAEADKGSVLLFHCTPSVNCLKSAIASSLPEGAKACILGIVMLVFSQSLFYAIQPSADDMHASRDGG